MNKFLKNLRIELDIEKSLNIAKLENIGYDKDID